MVRPKRLYIDEKTNKPYYLINKKKIFIKPPRAGISMKQLQKVNIKNIIQTGPLKKVKKRKKKVKPTFSKNIVTTMKKQVLPSPYGAFPVYIYQPPAPNKPENFQNISQSYPEKDKSIMKNAEMVSDQKQKIPLLDITPEKKTPTSVTKTGSTYTGVTEPSLSPSISENISDTFKSLSFSDVARSNLSDAPTRKSTRTKKPIERFIPGKGSDVSGDGLYNDEVEKIAKKRLKYFVPCIASDETEDLMKYVKRGDKEFAFVINTDPSTSPGRHWTAVYIDNRDSYPSMEYFDPLAEGRPPDAVINIMRKIAKRMNPEMMFKYKYNIIRRQANHTNNCGHHCVKFLEDRYNGIDWSEASGYEKFMEDNKERFQHADGSVMGEKEILKVMPKYNSYI